jgi:hypothetical protein
MEDELQSPYREETDEETGEPRIIMQVPRLTVDAMRDRVIRILSGELYPSDQVRDLSVLELVFMPLAMGACRPDPATIEKIMGSVEPPETIEGDPEKPEHPGYPEPEAEAPKYPELVRPNFQIRSDVEWGDREPEEWAAHWAEVEAKNQVLLQKWEREVEKHQKVLDGYREVQAAVDAEYEKVLEEWREELQQNADRNAERERVNQEWKDRYHRIFCRWGEDIGVFIGDMRKTFPRAINGYPMFFEFEIVHREDWARIYKALCREIERSKEIEV